MKKSEVFDNPTVNQVIFQITFPNLFFIENKIGEIQEKIMHLYPESQLLLKRQFIIASAISDAEIKESPETVTKIWNFKNSDRFELNITSDSLSIHSKYHKSYKSSENAEETFRYIIETTLRNFFEIIKLPIIKRMGLRYKDECPIFSKSNDSMKQHYNLIFSYDRFDFSDVTEYEYNTVTKRNGHFLRYNEKIPPNSDVLFLDFDAFSTDIQVADYLDTADALYDLINAEWQKVITEPLKKYMRTKQG